MALKALCIGINDYPGTGNDLNGCVNDANDWAAELRRRGFLADTLVDRSATGAQIRKRIKLLVESGERGDTILIQFSKDATYRQWHDAIRRKLPSQQYPQTPNLYGPAAMKNLQIFS